MLNFIESFLHGPKQMVLPVTLCDTRDSDHLIEDEETNNRANELQHKIML